MNAFDHASTTAPAKPRPAALAWADALAATGTIEAHPHRLLPHLIAARAKTHGAAPALLSDGECFTFAELDRRITAYAAWAIINHLGKGSRVALLMSNRPEYVAAWMGLSLAGVVTALINTNLTGPSLAHCLRLAEPDAVIVESKLLPAVQGCGVVWKSGLEPSILIHGEHPSLRRIDLEADYAAMPWKAELPVLSIDDKALLIYTSGTTGLPKAAHVSHRRILNWALWFKGMLGNTEADRMYDCLPLYHSVGGVVAVAATLVAGGSTVIADRFSASRFWDDIRRWQCTQVQYIGELCRYLLNTPPSDADGQHGLRVAVGNGLRADVWEAFRARFAIPQILEFYAATEGNFSLFNAEGRVGAIGRVPPFLRHRFPIAIVKHDAAREAPERGAAGLCIRAAIGEAGEAIARIGQGGNGSGRFEGYTDEAETGRKVLRNVFAEGDAWFRTGDLMRMDASGFYFFVDRIGDTFRWKGENVSTLEVANVLSGAPGVNDAVVYGVPVPGADGKAGMAFLDTVPDFDLEAFLAHGRARLPAYAVPLFIRLGRAAQLTETFKHRKQDLMREGFDPSASSDALFVLSPETKTYVTLDDTALQAIRGGAWRF